MHRTQILLEDAQYERLKDEAARTGRSIGDLVRTAVEQVYLSARTQEFLQALDESFGAAEPDDFDGLDGAQYVEQQRRGLARRTADHQLG
ncbi:MAG: ribbon-helix-helix protein, CopG family [Kineosporiaceae bacterium]|jgi:hypothetical protein